MHELQPLEASWRSFLNVQAYISRARVESFSLIADLNYVSQNAPRICRALFEICLRRGWSTLADQILALSKVYLTACLISYCSIFQISQDTGTPCLHLNSFPLHLNSFPLRQNLLVHPKLCSSQRGSLLMMPKPLPHNYFLKNPIYYQ